MVWPPIPSPDSQDSTCQQQVSKRRIVLSPLKHHVAQVWANQRFVTDEHTSRQQHVMHAQADWVLFLEKKTTTIKCQTLIYYPLKQMRCFCVRPVWELRIGAKLAWLPRRFPLGWGLSEPDGNGFKVKRETVSRFVLWMGNFQGAINPSWFLQMFGKISAMNVDSVSLTQVKCSRIYPRAVVR